MNYMEFQETIKNRIQNAYQDYQIELKEVPKWNGDVLMGLTICEGINVSMTIYLEESYEDYLKGSDLDTIIAEICGVYEENRLELEGNVVDLAYLENFDQIRSNIKMRVLNTRKNQLQLQTIPHLLFLDLSIIFYIDINDDRLGQVSTVVTNHLMDAWRMDIESMKDIAYRNIKAHCHYSIRNMQDILNDLWSDLEEESIAESEKWLKSERTDIPMYVLTNRNRIFGAAGILDVELLKNIGHKFKEDYYILPSSIHEVIVLPKSQNMNPNELLKMVQSINHDVVSSQEFLSDNIYIYESQSGILSVIEK